MRYTQFGLGFLVSLLLIGSCTQENISLDPQANAVSLLEHPEKHPQCLSIGTVSELAVIGRVDSYQQAVRQVKISAAERGGTHFVILSSESDEISTHLSAELYKCPSQNGEVPESSNQKEQLLILE